MSFSVLVQCICSLAVFTQFGAFALRPAVDEVSQTQIGNHEAGAAAQISGPAEPKDAPNYKVDPMKTEGDTPASPVKDGEAKKELAQDEKGLQEAAKNGSAAAVTAEADKMEADMVEVILEWVVAKFTCVNSMCGLVVWIIIMLVLFQLHKRAKRPHIGMQTLVCALCCAPSGCLAFCFPIDDGLHDDNEEDTHAVQFPELKLVDFSPRGGDADTFCDAHEKHDVPGLVALMTSTQQIVACEDKVHPWAENPQTVGTYAGLHLALIASKTLMYHGPNVKTAMLESGMIPLLVSFLRDAAVDRHHAGAIALYHLTTHCAEACHAAYKEGVVALLVGFHDSLITGFRCAAVATIFNIVRVSKDYLTELIQMEDGMKAIVEQLEPVRNQEMNIAETQLEALLNLQVVLEDLDGTLIVEHADKAIHDGAVHKLKVLMDSHDEDVSEVALELYDVLHERHKEQRKGTA